MSAGVPNYQKLHEMGKLPKWARANVPMLAELDVIEKQLEELKIGMCDDCRDKLFGPKPLTNLTATAVKCEVEGCEYLASGKTEASAKNNLRLHQRSHESKS